MKRKNIILIIVISFFVFAFLVKCLFSSPTPIEYAEKQSGLNLPTEIKLVKFTQNWKNTNGNGMRYIEFNLTLEQVKELQSQCLKKPYKNLPIKENGFNPSSLSRSDEGYYKINLLSKNNFDFELTVLDISTRKLFLIVDIP